MSSRVRWGLLHLLRQAAKDRNGGGQAIGMAGLTGISSGSLQLLTQSMSSSLGGLGLASGKAQSAGSEVPDRPYSVFVPPSQSNSQMFQAGIRGCHHN